jgi:hypothetical protein
MTGFEIEATESDCSTSGEDASLSVFFPSAFEWASG